MTKEKYTFTKRDMVKRTKSAQLAALLEANGWKRQTSGRLEKAVARAVEESPEAAQAVAEITGRRKPGPKPKNKE